MREETSLTVPMHNISMTRAHSAETTKTSLAGIENKGAGELGAGEGSVTGIRKDDELSLGKLKGEGKRKEKRGRTICIPPQ